MKRHKQFIAVHLLLAALVAVVVLVPNARPNTRGFGPLLAALAVIEGLFLLSLARDRKKGGGSTGPCDIMLFVWALFLAWELCTSVLNIAHPVLVPSPENVFDTFRKDGGEMLLNVAYSMQLLLVGFSAGMLLAIVCGLLAGWYPRLRAFAYPIANVMAPIPAVVFSPYLVSLMPTFRSASVVVIVLGVFWPNFLTTVNRVCSIEPMILDSARMLQPKTLTMFTHILIPYLIPGVVSGLKVSLTTSLLMLNYAELMGATHGMGYYVQNSITYANYTQAVAGIIVIGIVVTVLSALAGRAQRLIKWRSCC